MRPGQNKRMRGRNPNRKGPNPLTRSYESNGPDVKIRGTAHHVAEKYLQLARDAQSSGDPVAAESYLQHAEHYFRLIASAQQAQAQAQMGYPRTAEAEDEDDDDDYAALPDRFASPIERAPVVAAPVQQPYTNDRPNFNGGDRQGQPYGGNRYGNNNGGGDRPQGQDRYNGDRNANYGGGQDNSGNSGNSGGGGDRPYRNDRNDRNRNRFGRDNNSNGQYRDRNDQRDNAPRDYRDGQNNANVAQAPRDEVPGVGPQPFEPVAETRQNETRQNETRAAVETPRQDTRRTQAPSPAPVMEEAPGLPAFITAPVRGATPAETPADPSPAAEDKDGFPRAESEESFPVRPRRRRRSRAEIESAAAAEAADK